MKKAFFFSIMPLVALISCMVLGCTNKEKEYVDLGLSSGTLWKTQNEGEGNEFFDFHEAFDRFGNELPSIHQWVELANECEWNWMGNGYKVIGPNGKSIILPAAGTYTLLFDIGEEHVGDVGVYWSSEIVGSESISQQFFTLENEEGEAIIPDNNESACRLYFTSKEKGVDNIPDYYHAFSVRLVKRK